MADANQLKIEARRKEASGDYAAASQLYQRALAAMDEGNSLPDPSLLVRVADLEYRQDDAESALNYYHRAVEDYAEQGLITNAIAVCNKILRVFPEEIGCYRRLADLHMDVGLVAEARQNMLRFVDQAWDEGATDPALEAMEELLARSPDQEIALKMATCLDRLDRQEDAIEVLARVWRERTKADADVEGLERKARDLDPDVDLDEWLPSEEKDEEAGLAAADTFVSDAAQDEVPEPEPAAIDESEAAPEVEAETEAPEPAATLDAGEPAEQTTAEDAESDAEEREAADVPARSPLDELAEAARGLTDSFAPGDAADEPAPAEDEPAPAEDERAPAEEEARPAASDDASRRFGDPLGDRFDESPVPETSSNGDRPVTAPEPATIANRLEAAGEDARELELVASFPDWFSEREMTRPSNGSPPGSAASTTDSSTADSWEERTMDELDELEARAEAEVATAEADVGGGAPEGHLDEGPDRGSGDELPRGPEARMNGSSSGNDLGEKEELRRGLELLDDLLEVDPDNTELKERKVRYARRLGDREELVDAYLQLADAMAERGSRRGARLLFEKVLDLDEGNPDAEAGLGRLDRGELEQKRNTGGRGGSAEAPGREASPEQKEARRHLGMRLWTEFEKAVQEMPWLHAATQTYQSTGPDAAPPVEAFEMLAHYLISRDRCREAADILEQAVRAADRSDEEIADALYYLGLAHDRLGEEQKAAEYYRRLDQVDAEFASVREWLPEDEQVGA